MTTLQIRLTFLGWSSFSGKSNSHCFPKKGNLDWAKNQSLPEKIDHPKKVRRICSVVIFTKPSRFLS